MITTSFKMIPKPKINFKMYTLCILSFFVIGGQERGFRRLVVKSGNLEY